MNKHKWVVWLPLLVWVIVVCYLSFSSLPTKIVPNFNAADKFAHLLMYFTVEVFIYLPLKENKSRFKRFTFGAIGFAAFTEIVQGFFITNRFGDVYDFLANIIGLAIAYFFLIRKIKA